MYTLKAEPFFILTCIVNKTNMLKSTYFFLKHSVSTDQREVTMHPHRKTHKIHTCE